MPYRIDLNSPPADALDRLVRLGALDVEQVDGGLAALMPDSVPAQSVAAALGIHAVSVSPAMPRDDGSVWTLGPRAVRVGRLQIAPAGSAAAQGDLRLIDTPAFGTGLHPTTALCLEALEQAVDAGLPGSMLDVGTGSGVLALAALTLGVPRAVGVDIDVEALGAAADNARLNGLRSRLQLVRGGPEALNGAWPLVLANVLPAALIEMAPALVRRVGHGGTLVISGIPASMAGEVGQAYRHLGVRLLRSDSRAGWSALVLRPSW